MSLEELRSLITRHTPEGAAEPFDDVLLSREPHAGPPHLSSTGTVFALIVQGSKQLALGDRTYDYGAGEYLVASVDLPVTGRFTQATPGAPALGFGLTLHGPAIAELLLAEAAALPDRPPRGGPAVPALAVSRATHELLDAVTRLLRLLDRPRDLPILAPMVKREILWLLLTGPQGETVRQLGLPDSSLTHVGRTVRWLRENHAESVRVEELAASVGLSVSAFHRNFQAVTGVSPIEFQKRIRLQEARQQLAGSNDDVALVAYAVGYDSPSQFNREYRRLFGTSPGRDRQHLRATAGRE